MSLKKYDNRLIKVLPELWDKKKVKEILEEDNPVILHSLQLTQKEKLHALLDIKRVFIVLNKHFELEEKISIIIRDGYVNRNPDNGMLNKHIINGHYRIVKKDLHTFKFKEAVSSAICFALIGASGIGKSAFVEKILMKYPQLIFHHDLGLNQVVWLKIDCPYDASLKQLCINFFQEIDAVLDNSDYTENFGLNRKTIPEMITYMSQIANLHAVGVLVIDEIQNLNEAKSGGSQKMMNFFVTLANTIGIPILLIGTNKSLSFLAGDTRQARRSSGLGTVMWDRFNNNHEWKLFLKGILNYYWTEKPLEFTEEISDYIYYETQGITDLVVKLLLLSQMRAISLDLKQINKDLMGKIVKDCFTAVKPMLKALQEGSLDAILKYQDISPLNIDGFVNNYRSNIKIKDTVIQKKNLAKNQRAEIVRLVCSLGISREDANSLYSIAVKNKELDTKTEILGFILDKIRKNANLICSDNNKPTKSLMANKEIEIPQKDLRNINSDNIEKKLRKNDLLAEDL